MSNSCLEEDNHKLQKMKETDLWKVQPEESSNRSGKYSNDKDPTTPAFSITTSSSPILQPS